MPLDGIFAPESSLTLPSTPAYDPMTGRAKGAPASSSGGFAAMPGSAADPTTSYYDKFKGIFAPPKALDPMSVAADIKSLFGSTARSVTAPRATAATVALPSGTGDRLRDALFAAQFNPVRDALAYQGQVQDKALAGQLAQAGLADSGAGVGQRAMLADEMGRRTEAAARDISASATAMGLQADLTIASQNASMQQQVNLANAGFNMAAQQFNAQQLLQGNTAAAQGYLAALGLNASQANAFRDSFLKYLGFEQSNDLGKSQLAQSAATALMNYQLQQRALDLQQYGLVDAHNQEAARLALKEKEMNSGFLGSVGGMGAGKAGGGGGGGGGGSGDGMSEADKYREMLRNASWAGGSGTNFGTGLTADLPSETIYTGRDTSTSGAADLNNSYYGVSSPDAAISSLGLGISGV